MTVSTQRLTITQTWQQVATGNVTLIGCNTAASYHIHVGADKPTDESAFVTDKLTGGKDFNYNSPVWVKLNVNNDIDEADLIVVGEAFIAPSNTDDIGTDATGLFTRLINADYVATDKYSQDAYLAPKDTTKPYGGDLSQNENYFNFKFNPQNQSVTFATSTGVDIVFKNNFDGTVTILDDSQQLNTQGGVDINGVFYINNGSDTTDVAINYDGPNGWIQIKPWGAELAGGRKFTSMTVNGSATTIFHVTPPSIE